MLWHNSSTVTPTALTVFSGTWFCSQKAIASSEAWIASLTSFLMEKSYTMPSCSSIPRILRLCCTFLLMSMAIRVIATVTALETGKENQSQ